MYLTSLLSMDIQISLCFLEICPWRQKGAGQRGISKARGLLGKVNGVRFFRRTKLVLASEPLYLLSLCVMCSSMTFEELAPPHPSDLSSDATFSEKLTIPATVAFSRSITHLFPSPHGPQSVICFCLLFAVSPTSPRLFVFRRAGSYLIHSYLQHRPETQ